MNSYRSVFSLPDTQNNRNQVEIPQPPTQTVGVKQEQVLHT
jgi:hypothetical protein